MDGVNQLPKKAILASEELDLDDSEDESTPTGSLSSLAESVNSVSTITSFKSAQSNNRDESFRGSITSFQSIGTESINSFSSARSFKSAKSTTDTEFGSALSHSNSLKSLGTVSFKSCSTYASFKSARSHTDSEQNGNLTPTNSLGSFFNGSVESFQSFKSARSGTTYNGDDSREMFGSIGSLESFMSFKTFASFKNAKSDLSLSETITGDNDFASLHRFCTSPVMEKAINGDSNHSETDDEEEDFLDIGHNDTIKSIPVIGMTPDQESFVENKNSTNEVNEDNQNSIIDNESSASPTSVSASKIYSSESSGHHSLSDCSSEANTVFEENGSNNDIEIHDEESTENTYLLINPEDPKLNEAHITSKVVLINSPSVANQHQTETFSSETELCDSDNKSHMNGDISPLSSLANGKIPDQISKRPSYSNIDEIKDESRRQASFEEPNKSIINQVSSLPEVKNVCPKILFLIVSLITSQYIIRFGLLNNSNFVIDTKNLIPIKDNKTLPDYHWWRLIFWRSLLQCSLTLIVILSKQLLHCRTTKLHPSTIITKLNLYKLRYLLHSLMSFIFVAAMVESSKGLSTQELTIFYFCFPVIHTLLDIILERRLPNLIEILTNLLLITSIFMLTHHNTTSYPNTIHIENKTNNIETLNQTENQVINLSSLQNQIEFDKSANSEKRYPLFTLDLLYGWPIDPRNCESSIKEEIILKRNWTQEKIQSNKSKELKHKLKNVLHHHPKTKLKEDSKEDKKVWWCYLSAIVGVFVLSASLQLVIRSVNNNVTKVVFFQGLGALVYTFVASGGHSWTRLMFFDDESNQTSLFVLLVAYIGVISNILVISLGANAKAMIIDHRFFKYKSTKGYFTEVIMALSVIQILINTIVNILMPSEHGGSCCIYTDALAITCLSVILLIIVTSTKYAYSCCCYFRTIL